MLSDKTIQKINKFNKDRNWEKYHNGKDLALSVSLESSELLEIYQWNNVDLDRLDRLNKIKEELADVFIYAVQIAEKYHLNIDEIINEKLKKNSEKYPLDKENEFK